MKQFWTRRCYSEEASAYLSFLAWNHPRAYSGMPRHTLKHDVTLGAVGAADAEPRQRGLHPVDDPALPAEEVRSVGYLIGCGHNTCGSASSTSVTPNQDTMNPIRFNMFVDRH